MENHDTASLWKEITPIKFQYPKLSQNIETEVVIIGGGITGVSTAQQLIQNGKKVVLLEKHRVGMGTTGFSTGNLYIPIQPLYQSILHKFNQDTVNVVIKSRRWAISHIERTISDNGFASIFQRRPWVMYTNDKSKVHQLEKEFEVLKVGGCKVEEITHLALPFPFLKAIQIENQARFNPLQYVLELAQHVSNQGCAIFEDTAVEKWEENADGCTVYTHEYHIKAQQVVMATHVPLGVNAKQQLMGPYRSYVVAGKLRETLPNANFWDLQAPHHAISTHSSQNTDEIDIIAIAGSHHKTGQEKSTVSHFEELENYLRQNFTVESVQFHWSAQHYQSADGLPYIGLASHHHKNTYLATGFFADGLVYGVLAGNIIASLICKKENEFAPVYDARRFTPIASVKSFLSENANVFIQYLKDVPGHADTNSFEEVKKEEGKLVEKHGEKLAVYRDSDNQLHIVSAVCTHLQGIVQWNNGEKSWDCPCHGSRFDINGEVIEGPALYPLKKEK